MKLSAERNSFRNNPNRVCDAYHEAGHAVGAFLVECTPTGLKLHRDMSEDPYRAGYTIVEAPWELLALKCQAMPEKLMHRTMERKVIRILAGLIAGAIRRLGFPDWGGRPYSVKNPFFSEEWQEWGGDEYDASDRAEIEGALKRLAPPSDRTSTLLRLEMETLKMVVDNWKLVEAIAERALQKISHYLSEKELKDIIRKNRPSEGDEYRGLQKKTLHRVRQEKRLLEKYQRLGYQPFASY